MENLASIKWDQWEQRRWNQASTLEKIQKITEEHTVRPQTQEVIDKIAYIFVARRRHRSRTELWEVRALGVKYRCLELGCSEGQRLH